MAYWHARKLYDYNGQSVRAHIFRPTWLSRASQHFMCSETGSFNFSTDKKSRLYPSVTGCNIMLYYVISAASRELTWQDQASSQKLVVILLGLCVVGVLAVTHLLF